MRGEEYTFTGSFPTLIEKSGNHGSKRRLDYIFTNADLLPYVHQAAVIANNNTWILSDHMPVIVDFRVHKTHFLLFNDDPVNWICCLTNRKKFEDQLISCGACLYCSIICIIAKGVKFVNR